MRVEKVYPVGELYFNNRELIRQSLKRKEDSMEYLKEKESLLKRMTRKPMSLSFNTIRIITKKEGKFILSLPSFTYKDLGMENHDSHFTRKDVPQWFILKHSPDFLLLVDTEGYNYMRYIGMIYPFEV